MWPPPPPSMRHPSQFVGCATGRPPPPVFPSHDHGGPSMDYPPGSSALPPHFPPLPPLAAAAAAAAAVIGTNGIDERAMPPWHRRMGGPPLMVGDSWKTAAAPDSSWRQQPRQFGPYSNHEFYRQQYAHLPLSRPYPNFHPVAPPLSHMGGHHPGTNTFGPPPPHHLRPFEGGLPGTAGGDGPVAVPPEYATASRVMDYERRLLREHCDEARKMGCGGGTANAVASNFCDFSRVLTNDDRDRGMESKRPGECGGIELLTQPSARRIRVKWSFRVPESNDKLKLHLTVRLEKLEGGLARVARGNELGVVQDTIMPIHITHTEFNALPGSSYRIELSVIDSKDNQLASGTAFERAIFSLDEMKVLMQKAISHTGTEMQPFTYLYRCKPKIYWDYVIGETRAEMNVYEKDSNGQAASPINTAISGLFFSARLDPRGQVPTQSPFGDIRFMLPASALLQPHLNLYFADFYCNSKPHYVTVVVCQECSDIDRFCRQTLLPLSPFDNPFLLFQPNNSPTVPMTYSANRNVWVEIYYTDPVPLAWGQLHHISTFGVGTSKIGGLPHNKSCRVCNLYPQGPPPAGSGDEAVVAQGGVEHIPVDKAEQMVREAEAAELVDDDNHDGVTGGQQQDDGRGAGQNEAATAAGDDEDGHQQHWNVTNWESSDGPTQQRQVTFDELQNRLQRIERVIANDGAAAGFAIDASSHQKIVNCDNGTAPPTTTTTTTLSNLVDFAQQIGTFLLEMHNDFIGLNTKIDTIESSIWAQQGDGGEADGLEVVDVGVKKLRKGEREGDGIREGGGEEKE